jgi:hypothetical protein
VTGKPLPLSARPRSRGLYGASGTFDDAIGEFAIEYADQNERDYRRFVTAIKEGRIEAAPDV